ncbi:MAG: SCO family protein [Chloroflexi bacterium]|nr:MAG: SCO family protein [Chloroflexota bacterium]
MKKPARYLVFGAVILVGMLAVIYAAAAGRPHSFSGTEYLPLTQSPEIELTDQTGKPFRLSEQAGNVVLIFYGYTNCPDVCPITLGEFKQIKAALGEEADRVRFVFITVDPERDTREVLEKHISRFDPSFFALTGKMSELEPVYKAYGVYHEKVDLENGQGYMMNHSGHTYVIDLNGNLRMTYAFGSDTEDMTEDIRQLLREN